MLVSSSSGPTFHCTASSKSTASLTSCHRSFYTRPMCWRCSGATRTRTSSGRVRRGFVTGLVLDRHACSLEDYLGGEEEGGDGSGRCVELLQNQDSKKRFVDELESAVQHLHALGWAHNDIQPGNVLVAIRPGTGVANRDHDGSRAQGRPPGKAAVVIRPILIDFESARRVGEKLGTSRGRDGWIDCDRKDYRTSEVCHDVWALDRMHEWVDGYPFRDGQVDGNLPG
ncbi:kinase-like protein [Apiospora marii]|uniref:Kinase-like protein n=1 Tax=Apiospora marii TaxID=335849 RepID=A0ABR1R7M4_9PEZI